uniref:FLYWCH-type domain-containing protein n=1 Tax=Daphnia galeata TaxID=27404 RepID=A0A8J2S7X2_9CRUS|nr:unnamed protein product [Daphnia galeata]
MLTSSTDRVAGHLTAAWPNGVAESIGLAKSGPSPESNTGPCTSYMYIVQGHVHRTCLPGKGITSTDNVRMKKYGESFEFKCVNCSSNTPGDSHTRNSSSQPSSSGHMHTRNSSSQPSSSGHMHTRNSSSQPSSSGHIQTRDSASQPSTFSHIPIRNSASQPSTSGPITTRISGSQPSTSGLITTRISASQTSSSGHITTKITTSREASSAFVQRTTIQLSSTPNADSAFKTIERGKVPPPRITSDSDSSRNEAPAKRRFEEPVSENAVFSAEFSSHFEEPVRENTVFSAEFSSHFEEPVRENAVFSAEHRSRFEEPVRENAVFSAELSSRFEEPVPVREDSYQFNGMIQAASDDEDWEDMDIDPLSPPPKWIVLEKALRKNSKALFDSKGHKYGIKRKSLDGKKITWRCTVRWEKENCPGIVKEENGVYRETIKHTCQKKKDVHVKARVYSKCKEEIRKNRHAVPRKVSEPALLEEYLDDEEAELPKLSNLNRALYKIKEATRPANPADLHFDMKRYVQAIPKPFFERRHKS